MNIEIHLPPKESKILEALKIKPRSVLELMKIASTTNPAEYISRLRARQLQIVTQRLKKRDESGEFKTYGVYHLLDEGTA